MLFEELLPYIAAGILLATVFSYASTYFKPGLRQLPGPFFARLTSLYRISMVIRGECPSKYELLHAKYGRIVRTGPNHVSIDDPESMLKIYGVTSKFVKSDYYSLFVLFYKEKPQASLISMIDPAEHKALRAPIAPKFSMSSIRSFEPAVDECYDIFKAQMLKRAGKPLDFGIWCQYFAFDLIAQITFQHRFGFLEEGKDINNMIARIGDALVYTCIIGQIPSAHPWLVGNRRLLRALESIGLGLPDPTPFFIKLVEDQIKAYDQEEKVGETDLLAWMRLEHKKGKSNIGYVEMVNHLVNTVIAGSDTTAVSIRAIFYYLVKNTHAYKRLLEEINQQDSRGLLSSHVTWEQSLQMPYLQAVIKEAMRLCPGVGLPLERVAPAEGADLCGYNIPGGTKVGMLAHSLHMNHDIYGPDVASFRPERWLEASTEKLRAMERYYFAFGHGSRACIGRNISMLEMGKFVPQLLRDFDIEWAAEWPEWTVKTWMLSKQSGMVMKLLPKGKNEL